MADLFGQLLGVRNQRNAGTMEGTGKLRALELQLAQTQEQQRRRSLMEALQQQEAQQKAEDDRVSNDLRKAQTSKLLRELDAPPKVTYSSPIVGPDGQLSVYNTNDPTQVKRVPGVRARVPQEKTATPRRDAPQAKTTDGERTAGAQLTMAKQAADAVDQFAPSIAQNQLGKIPVIGNTIVGMTDDNYQAYQQAAQQFITAYVYAVSGKAVTDKEFDRLYNTMITQPGDNAQAQRAKAAARRTALDAMQTAAGRAGSTTGAATNGTTDDPILAKYGLTPKAR